MNNRGTKKVELQNKIMNEMKVGGTIKTQMNKKDWDWSVRERYIKHY